MEEVTLSKETHFNGRIFRVERHQIRLPDGSESIRDIIRHPGAIGVVARTPDGSFIMVRQYRKAVEAVTLEIVAGTIDPGEDTLTTAHRELKEETGYTADTLHEIGHIHPSPGFLEERITLYFGEVNPLPGKQKTDPDENVEVALLTRADVEAAITGGKISDSKTLAAWLMFEKSGFDESQ